MPTQHSYTHDDLQKLVGCQVCIMASANAIWGEKIPPRYQGLVKGVTAQPGQMILEFDWLLNDFLDHNFVPAVNEELNRVTSLVIKIEWDLVDVWEHNTLFMMFLNSEQVFLVYKPNHPHYLAPANLPQTL